METPSRPTPNSDNGLKIYLRLKPSLDPNEEHCVNIQNDTSVSVTSYEVYFGTLFHFLLG